jgi:hypothetical protein
MAALAVGTPEDKERVAVRLDQHLAAGDLGREATVMLQGLRDPLRGSDFKELCRTMRPSDALLLKGVLAIGESVFSLGGELQDPLLRTASEVPVSHPAGPSQATRAAPRRAMTD